MANGSGPAPTGPVKHRLLPPAGVGVVTFNGRSFDGSSGNPVDVNEQDSNTLQANGWAFLGMVGTTAQRPTSALGTHPLVLGQRYYDTTVSKTLLWNGAVWKDEAGTTR